MIWWILGIVVACLLVWGAVKVIDWVIDSSERWEG